MTSATSSWSRFLSRTRPPARSGPAAVISSADYHRHRPDLLILAVTSQTRPAQLFGEATVAKWQQAGLLKPSVIKPVIATIDRALVLRRLGRPEDEDKQSMRQLLLAILGS
jgi:mRNA interferase MazF